MMTYCQYIKTVPIVVTRHQQAGASIALAAGDCSESSNNGNGENTSDDNIAANHQMLEHIIKRLNQTNVWKLIDNTLQAPFSACARIVVRELLKSAPASEDLTDDW